MVNGIYYEMNRDKKSKAQTKIPLSALKSIPNQIGFIICKDNQIVHTTIPDQENSIQIAFYGIRLASRTTGPEFQNHRPHTIQVQFEKFMYEMFHLGDYFVIVKKKLDEGDE